MKHNQTTKKAASVPAPKIAAAPAPAAQIKYRYPKSLGEHGEFLSKEKFDSMDKWPEVPGWYEYAKRVGNTSGTYAEYVADLKSRCEKV